MAMVSNTSTKERKKYWVDKYTFFTKRDIVTVILSTIIVLTLRALFRLPIDVWQILIYPIGFFNGILIYNALALAIRARKRRVSK